MVSLVSLLGDILSLRWRDRIELPSQVRPRLLQPSAKILDLLRVHEFLVCRGLIPGRKFDDHFIHPYGVDHPWIMRALRRNSQWACTRDAAKASASAKTDPVGELFAGRSHLFQRDLFSLAGACYAPADTKGRKPRCGRSRSVTSPSTQCLNAKGYGGDRRTSFRPTMRPPSSGTCR